MKMRNATQTSKVPTRVTLLFTNYSVRQTKVFKLFVYLEEQIKKMKYFNLDSNPPEKRNPVFNISYFNAVTLPARYVRGTYSYIRVLHN